MAEGNFSYGNGRRKFLISHIAKQEIVNGPQNATCQLPASRTKKTAYTGRSPNVVSIYS
jgi:hypothetical protein